MKAAPNPKDLPLLKADSPPPPTPVIKHRMLAQTRTELALVENMIVARWRQLRT